NNLDEVAPTFTSGTTAAAIDENSGAGQVVYTATADDTADISGGVTFSLGGTDAGAFSIDSGTGEVTLTGDPDHETKSSYSFDVTAADAAGNTTTQTVTLGINNLDEVAPTFTSGTTAAAINENSGAGQVVYTAAATDPSLDGGPSNPVTYSLGGTDAGAFSIDSGTGAVTLTGNPNFEGQSSYSFDVTATDAAGNSTTQTVTLGINNLDEVAPTFTSGTTAAAIDENSGAGQVVYTATASDPSLDGGPSNPVTYSLGGTDAGLFTINGSDGKVTLTGNPNYEAKGSYSFDVTATDAAGNSTTQTVTLAINDLDEVAPSFTSGTTAAAIDENSGAGQVVYTATADDTADISGGVTFSLGGTDAGLFTINSGSGAVTLTGAPDHETKSSYSFDVTATDAAGNSTTQTVTLAINDLDEVAPSFTSGTTAAAIDENSGAGQVVYTATATDTGDIATGSTNYSLKPATGDGASFTINSSTGAVTLTGNPDFETKPSYSFTVVATDTAGNASEQAVSLAINNVNDAPIAAPINDAIAVGSAYSKDLRLGATDPDGDALSVANVPAQVTTAGGRILRSGIEYNIINGTTFALTAFGVAKFNTLAAGSPPDTLTINYEVSDGQATTSSSLTLDVLPEPAAAPGLGGPILGDTKANTLASAGGNDTLIGGKGNDTYIVDLGDTITELVNGGNDTVRTDAAHYLLGANLERLVYTGGGDFVGTGNALANVITGGAGDDALVGGRGNDRLTGGAGDDSIDGGIGADMLIGGAGNDTYIINSFADQIVETAGAGGGTDTVFTALSQYTLPQNVENLTYIGAGNFNGTGNARANTLTGGAGKDKLDGGAGNDTLDGGAGKDTLIGGGGKDTLIGGGGNDVLTGGAGADTFVFAPNWGEDVITDFDPTKDVLKFDGSIASALAELTVTQVGADVLIEGLVPGHLFDDTITLKNVNAALLQDGVNVIFGP
ncbi:MAG TPA: cadherin domain-containing protein, partial [Hyphomicrobiaceae bacterium]|nr:cadherin domain-containing protein [Hyphomicrobiaceae bacterium]